MAGERQPQRTLLATLIALLLASPLQAQELPLEEINSDALFDNRFFVGGEPLDERFVNVDAATETATEGDAAVVTEGAAEAAVDEKRVVELMEEARHAMFEHDYNRAIKVYTEVVELPDNIYRRDALESLGLAYERGGDFEAAQRSYERYVQLYPQGDDTDRVRQRLAGLVTAEWNRPKKAEEKPAPDNWRHYGSLYQLLRRSGSSIDDEGTIIGQHMLITTVDFNSRGREGGVEIKSRINGSYLYDLRDEPGEAKEHQQQLSYLYADLSRRNSGLYGRIGRQRANGGGVLGRFDGLNMGWRLSPEYAATLVAGFPVERTSDTAINRLRRFRGIGLEGGPWRENWLANGYYIQQISEGYLDREAAGAELRYIHPRRSLYTLVDYDIHFRSLNIFSSQMSFTSEANTLYNLILDYRNSPPLNRRSALLGQSVTTLDALRRNYSDDEITQLARDRTPHYYMVNASLSQPLGERLIWEADATVSRVSATPESAGVAATASTPAEYYYSTRLNLSNYFREGDVHIVGLNLVDGATYRMTMLLLNSRVPFGAGWYINPRLQLGYRHLQERGDKERLSGAGLRVEYELLKNMTLELDGSTDWNEIDTLLGRQRAQSFYVTAGYRLLF